MAKDVIIACDFPGKTETLEFLDLFKDKKPFVKIGMELFYSEGPDIVKEIKDRGHKIFLDLKLHDIPNTVEKSMEALSGLGADMTNVHAAGGSEMMKRALTGFKKNNTHGQLIAVTQLTSTAEDMLHNELLIPESIEDTVAAYAKNAADSGLAGVVCSPLEADKIHKTCGEKFITVTPGIRFKGSVADDQKRITTPEKARLIGSDYIVVGRPIRNAEDPVAAYERCLKEFLGL